MAEHDSPRPTLPENARLLHVGTMKSGTSSLQYAASRRRTALLDEGVCYPGKSLNHYSEAFAFMGARREGKVPPQELWDKLMDEIQDDSVRAALISHERICEATDEAIQRFADTFGSSLHVLVTLRPLTGMLGSFWQQQVKTGAVSADFADWLAEALDPPVSRGNADLFQRHGDHAGIVQRWVSVLGPERVTVLIGDKSRPQLISSSVERMLGLSEGLLTPDGSATGENRSLSMAEAELLRRTNRVFEDNGVPWMEYGREYRRAAFTRMLSLPRQQGDPGIVLPAWAADKANQVGYESAEIIEMSGVTVIGSLESLYAPVVTAEDDQGMVPSHVPMEAAVAALVGTVGGGLGRGPFLDLAPAKKRNGESKQPVKKSSSAKGNPSVDSANKAGFVPVSSPQEYFLGSARLEKFAGRVAKSGLFAETPIGQRAVRFGRRWLRR